MGHWHFALSFNAARLYSSVFVFALILDVICQFVVFRWVYPGETLLVATVLGNVPYLLVRGPVNRIASSGSKGRGGR
ncbi:MAG: hypothetical protein WAM53_14695 [Terrimicrobiaceae bacterium]